LLRKQIGKRIQSDTSKRIFPQNTNRSIEVAFANNKDIRKAIIQNLIIDCCQPLKTSELKYLPLYFHAKNGIRSNKNN